MEERKYLCPECGYKCKWVNQLKYHMTKHTGMCYNLIYSNCKVPGHLDVFILVSNRCQTVHV